MSTVSETRRIAPIDESGNEFPSLPAGPIQKVQTQYTTAIAVQQPRDLRRVERMAMDEAAILGEDAYYAWGAGQDRIEGPSKELAMTLVRVYGNCAIDLGEVQETKEAWIFTAKFIDLETGFTMSRQFRQSKGWTVYGKLDQARKEDIRFQIGQSKAVRNVILNAVPGWLVKRAMDKAKGGVREKIEKAINEKGLEKVQIAYLDVLKSKGATPERVLESMGRKNAAQLSLEDLVILAGSLAALTSGADTVEDLFPIKTSAPAEPKPGDSPLNRVINAAAAVGTAPQQETKPQEGEPKPEATESQETEPDKKPQGEMFGGKAPTGRKK